MARTAMSRSAEGATIIALLPPSSSMARPNRAATFGPTTAPIRVEPVAETIGTSREATSASPIAAPPMTSCASPSGASGPKRFAARSKAFIAARALSGVFSDGFQTTGSPQTSASAAFHAQTATGKLNAEMTAHGPHRMPGLHHAVARALGGDGKAVDLARQAHGEVADVDHLLHLAETLGDDLSGFEGDDRADRLLGGAQFLPKEPNEFAPARSRDVAPQGEGGFRAADDRTACRPRASRAAWRSPRRRSASERQVRRQPVPPGQARARCKISWLVMVCALLFVSGLFDPKLRASTSPRAWRRVALRPPQFGRRRRVVQP